MIERMTIYIAKMAMFDLNLSEQNPSVLAIGSIYVALKICEQQKKKNLTSEEIVAKMFNVSKLCESEILKVSRKLLYLAQNFDEEFQGLEQLKKTHFGIITKLL